jgi:predicted DCC family thiol-disulfide oxidoreductase YuxK
MKTLEKHVILYDNQCPLCCAYTAGFVKTQMLDDKGRAPFSNASSLIEKFHVDQKRACDEIALIDTVTGRTAYGIDSIFMILSHRFPLLRPILRNALVKAIFVRLYAFISYNRKVIIPARATEGLPCVPSFNLRYRIAFLLFAWIVTSLILTKYSTLLTPIIPATNFYREFLICGGQILFQGMVIAIMDKNKVFDYLGNMMTVSLAGAMILFVITPLSLIVHQPLIYVAVFAFVVLLMFTEHIRRTRLLQLSWIMTFSWVVYRVIVLALIV